MEPVNVPSYSNVLVWGILGLAFSAFFYTSPLGIVFSIVGICKANTYFRYREYSKQARIGSILAKVGLGVGIAFTILLAVTIFLLIYAANTSIIYY